MSAVLESIRRVLVVKVQGKETQTDISDCPWCGNLEVAICASCHNKANEIKQEDQTK